MNLLSGKISRKPSGKTTAIICALLLQAVGLAAAPHNIQIIPAACAASQTASGTDAETDAQDMDDIKAKEMSHSMLELRPLVEWPATAATLPKAFKITILGDAVVPQARMVEFIRQWNPEPKLNCSVEELVSYYYTEAAIEGIRPDVALCQAMKETATFRYGHDVRYYQNNYCGLGAVGGGAHGYSFFTPQRGVRAHIQHLSAYANTGALRQQQVDPRYDVLVTKYPQYHGCAKYWSDLNGRWAVPGTHYGQEILMIWYAAQGIDMDVNGVHYGTSSSAAPAASSNPEVAKLVKKADYLRTSYSDESAVKAYDEALAIEPDNETALLGKGQQLFLLKDPEGALSCFDRLVALNKDNALALFDRGSVLLYLGKKAAARKDLERAAKLEPENAFIKERLKHCN